ncbi:hypothetical protein ACT7C0_11255 [Bacillus cereus]
MKLKKTVFGILSGILLTMTVGNNATKQKLLQLMNKRIWSLLNSWL